MIRTTDTLAHNFITKRKSFISHNFKGTKTNFKGLYTISELQTGRTIVSIFGKKIITKPLPKPTNMKAYEKIKIAIDG